MALLTSQSLPLGTALPSFALPDPAGIIHTSKELTGPKGILVIIACNHCPYVKAVWERIAAIGAYALAHGIGAVAINPNIHPDYPEDRPEEMAQLARRLHLSFPYLVDETQEIARALNAVCTPEFYLFGHTGLFYHGRLDDNWKDASNVGREELKEAIDRLVAGDRPPTEQIPSMGCSIKWRND
ncbi:MAG: thioredoxin family protein [Campylobacterales bacterium]